MQCPACKTENPKTAKFCLECGNTLVSRCNQCGAELPNHAIFCPNCGMKLAQPAGAPAPVAPLGERRIVTMLFADVKGSTALAEQLDPEDVMEIINGAFDYLISPIYRHEGTLVRLMGDGILAFFGAPLSQEDDPERAVRAALEIQAGIRSYAAQLAAERGIDEFNVRVGINTGLVVVGDVGSDLHVEWSGLGDAVNMAARMEQNAPPGGILITHDTYRLVRDAFDLQQQPPLAVKGHAEPMQAYLVLGARPQPFGKVGRGVEGVEVRMIGRDAELAQLEASLEAVDEDRALEVVTIIGDAGVGKSRLLYEFERRLKARHTQPHIFRGRATSMSQHEPYGLLRDLFARECGIFESDSTPVVRAKLEQGVTRLLRGDDEAAMKAHFVGQLLGFDFSDSPYLRGVLGDARQLRDRGHRYLVDLFRAASAEGPILVLLEDLHWADDSSLDAVNHLALSLATSRILFVCATRPALLERRAHWGEGNPGHSRLALGPLSLHASRRLASEILQKVDHVPESLRDVIVTGAEGNPFFAEELVKMFVEDGIIVKGGADGSDSWRVQLDRLSSLRVPETLTGVLQARLDRLTPAQRSVLQQASVVGRQFWDQAVAQISSGEAGALSVTEALAALRAREMVFQREASAFAGTQEYLFKHALLREVAYESVLKRLRRVYHSLVADWLIEQGGERVGEITGLIGEHLERAGRAREAAAYLARAAASAVAKFANEEAIRYYRRALALTESSASEGGLHATGEPALHAEQGALLVSLTEGLGDVYELLSQKGEAQLAYQSALVQVPEDDVIGRARLRRKLANNLRVQQVQERLAELEAAEAVLGPTTTGRDRAWWSEWLELQLTRMWSYYWDSRPDAIDELVGQVHPALEAHGSLQQRGNFFRCLANASLVRNQYHGTEQSVSYIRMALACDREAGNLRQMATDQFMGGMHLLWFGKRDEAEAELKRAFDLADQVGDAWVKTIALTYLAICCRFRGSTDETRVYAGQTLEMAAKAGLDLYVAQARGNLAWVAWRHGDFAAAEELARAGLPDQLQLLPFRWLAALPLLDIALTRGDKDLALFSAREMLRPLQQRLPEGLDLPLRAGVQAGESGSDQDTFAAFRQVVTVARELAYI